MIVRNFRMCIADHGQQGGFPNVRKTDQPDICQQLQFQGNISALSRQTRLCKSWYLSGRGCKVHVAPTAAPAFCRKIRLSVRHIVHQRTGFRIPDQSACRNTHQKVFPVFAGTPFSLPVCSVLGNKLPLIPKIHQGGQIIIGNKYDTAAASAVSAVRPACRNIFLPVKCDCTVSAFPSADMNPRMINKT